MLKNRLPSTAAAKWTTLGVSLVTLGLAWIAGAPAQANVTLTRADIEAILNRVELIPRGRSARMARQRDFMSVGDTLRTAAQAQAQLRFNDGSLARVGERATFQFLPNTRNFRLSNGTMLLLIPPGRGRSTIQTPSAITGIQGSAVVVRHSEERNLTLVMALTNNPAGPMTVTTQGCGGDRATDHGATDAIGNCVAEHVLYAGQMAIVQNNQVQILEFDLPTFYDTNSLTDGLDLNNPDPETSLGPALDQVRTETLEALSRESAFTDTTVLNPAAVAIDPSPQNLGNEPRLLSPAIAETQAVRRPHLMLPATSSLVGVPLVPTPRDNAEESGPQAPAENSPVARPTQPASNVAAPTQSPAAQRPVTQASDVEPPAVQPPDDPQPPVVEPPAVQPPDDPQPPVVEPPEPQPPNPQPPEVEPPTTEPPVVQPPVVEPPVVEPPVVEPPVVEPPVVEPPVVQPPNPQPPVVEPPTTEPPVVQPPVVEPPVVEPPVVEPPVVQPPNPQPPVVQPPTTEPPVVQPPGVEPPVVQPPVVEPPVVQPPAPQPPVVPPPVVDPPVAGPPVVEPPVVEPPVVQPPAPQPPVLDPSVIQPIAPLPPVVDPPVEDLPVVEPPTRPTVPANPPPFSDNPAVDVPATPPANPPVIFQPDT